MNKEINAAKMAEAEAQLEVVKRLLSAQNLSNEGYSQAFSINQALNNIANAQILLSQTQQALEALRT